MRWKTKYKKTKRYSRKIFKWGISILFLLLVVGYLIFKSSYVQTYISQKLGAYLSKKTETTITVGAVDFKPFDTFVLKDLLILDHHKDTMLFTSDFYFEINEYDFKNLKFNLDLIEFNNAYLNINTYQNEHQSNLKRFIKKLSSNDSIKKNKNPQVYIEDIALEDLRLRIRNQNLPKTKEKIDFNHLELFDLNMDADDFIFKDNLIRINTEQFSFKEKSGFELLGMSGQLMMDNQNFILKYLEIETNDSDLNGDVSFEYKDWKSWSNFIEEVYIETYFEETRVSSNDVEYFTDLIEGLNRSVTFQGNINGTVSTLKAENLKFNFGELTQFDGEIEFNGLGVIDDPIINAKISNLITFEKDIKNIPLPPFTSGKTIRTPKWMKKIGKMEFKGDFIGPTSNFEATGILKTNAGIIKSDVFFKSDSIGETRIVGSIITNQFDLGKTIDNPNFGLLSMNGSLDALAQFEDNRLIFSGKIPRIDYKGYSYSNITMDGTIRDEIFKGKLAVKDENLEFDFNGGVDFSTPRLQKYDFEAELKRANLRNINWSSRDSSTQVTGRLQVNMVGNKFEDLDGYFKLNDITWKENGEIYKVDSINLNAIKEDNRELIILKSDLMIAKIEGTYNLDEIFPTMVNVFSKEIPSLVKDIELNNFKGGNKFNVMFKLLDYSMINKLFLPELILSDRTRLSGRFNDVNKSFVLHFATDSLMINGRIIKDIKLNSNNIGNKLNIIGQANFIQVVNNLGIENFKINSNIQNNLLGFNLIYGNNSIESAHGDISGILNLANLDTIKLGIDESKIVFNNSIWEIDPSALINFSNKHIFIKNFNFKSADQFLKVNGVASSKNSDSLLVEMNNFQLIGLQYFWNYINLDVTGKSTGFFKINGAFHNHISTTSLQIEEMILNKQKFGKVKISSDYKNSIGVVNTKVVIENRSKTNKFNNLIIEGDYFPFENGRIDMSAKLKNTQLKFLEKYFDGVFSNFRGGKTSGELVISGTLNHPLINGDLKIDHLKFSIDYLNISYNIDGQTVSFNNDFINFKDFIISHDTRPKSKARVNGYVDLNGFNNISYSMDSVFLDEFFCLNTTINENTTYYGEAYVNGLIQLRGNSRGNYIGGSIATTKSIKFEPRENRSGEIEQLKVPTITKIELPLDQSEDLEISEFVSFINLSDTSTKKKLIEEDFDLSGLDLDFNIKFTPEANIRIIFDPTVGDEINAKGNGEINMAVNTNGKFNMYGDFTVSEGNYFFTLQNIIGKKFIVEPGSKISWNGNPLDAQIAMKTYYKSRANLIDLVDLSKSDSASLVQQFDNRIEVHSNLGLFGSLWKPDLKIGISLPNGTTEELNFLQERISGDDEINRQAFALILTSQFLRPSSGFESIVSDKAGFHNGMQFVEGQINNALSGLLHPNLDLGVDYNEVEETGSADNLTKDELRLLAGFKYKNLVLKTDYDINNQVGDIEAEFKITEALKAKAYHKTVNDATTLNNQVTTTYGLGASYQKSFDSLKDLFRRKKEENK